MTLARILLKLWKLRLWVGLGGLLGVVAAVGSVTVSHSTVYATASTQMLVDSPTSALANAGADITGYLARANVFARLMTSNEALRYIGQAAGIPGNLINANGPIETNGSPIASHAPTAIQGGKNLPAPANYKLSFLQNPDLPTVDVYAQAPTTAQAISLANGAVTGFATFVNQLDGNNVPLGKRIEVRQLGGATSGIVAPSASKKMAVLVFFAVVAMWCGLVVFMSRLLAQLRTAKKSVADDLFAVRDDDLFAIRDDDLFAIHEDELTPAHAPGNGSPAPLGDHPPPFAPAADREWAGRRWVSSGPILRTSAPDPTTPPTTSGDPKEQRVGPPRQEDVRDEVGLWP